MIAERGEQVESEDADTRFFVLRNGRRYEGLPGTTDFRVMEFVEHDIPYRLPDVSEPDERPRAMGTLALMKSRSSDKVAELQWRIGVPLSTFILGILAVPLSRSQPRQGRYGRLAVGLLVFIIYFNLLGASKAWVEQEAVPAVVGMWWVHAIMLGAAGVMLAYQNGMHRRILPRRGS